MASTVPVPVDQPQVKPSFAKVAASTYKPQLSKETPLNNTNTPAMNAAPILHSQNTNRMTQPSAVDGTVRNASFEEDAQANAGNTATGAEQWSNTPVQPVALEAGNKEEPEKSHPSITLVKALTAEDNTTQLSSSDGSVKLPSLDGKSVASGTTFALDEKESIRPDDSASLRAVEEEDIASPPDSVAAGSRVGSDSGVARAFRDQLHEISVMGPLPQRAPPGRFPNPSFNSTPTLYDPNQSADNAQRSHSQPIGNGIPTVTGPHNIPAVPDDKLLEALESPRDRLFVLKLEQDFIDFIKDSNENELSLPNCNTFYRMLAHRLADYYLLGHVVDTTLTGVKITRTSYCRMPPPLSGLPISSKNTNTPPVELPARKILRRGDGDPKSGTNTNPNSEGPSKAASEVGGGSGSEAGTDAENKDKSALTREEREARYRETRQRIFGNAEHGESESSDVVGDSEEKDVSRSSSASGKKKNKKQRNYDDDDFEARSRFNVYYTNQYTAPGFGGDSNSMYYGYGGPMPSTQYPGMGANMSPPPMYNGGYPVMMSQEGQQQYGWPSQPFQPSNGTMPTNYNTAPNGYDLSADFNRGMQSFQSANMPTQVTPKMANAPMASYQDNFQQPQNMPMNSGWQMSPQPSYPVNQLQYTQHPSGNRSMSGPMGTTVTGTYPYGQFPPPSFHGGKSNRNQHPLPGSYNRQQFNPQSQAFVPGGRNAPFPMQPNIPPMPPQGMNYGNFSMPPPQMPNQLSNQMPRPSPPVTHPQVFESPRGPSNGSSVPPRPVGQGANQSNQSASGQPSHTSTNSSQSSNASLPAQSSIAKWGTPSHLPPKPPPPAQAQPPKFSIPGHNFPNVPRLPNMPPQFPPSMPIMRGGGPTNSS